MKGDVRRKNVTENSPHNDKQEITSSCLCRLYLTIFCEAFPVDIRGSCDISKQVNPCCEKLEFDGINTQLTIKQNRHIGNCYLFGIGNFNVSNCHLNVKLIVRFI
jgi:hypothetical protein